MKTQLKIISEYYIIINRDRSIDFVVDSDDSFKSYGVSLFSISVSKMYGERDFLVANNDCINYLRNLIAHKNGETTSKESDIKYDFYWQYEVYVEILEGFVYVEKWGLCTKISLEDFLEIFETIQSFLERWKNKDILINQIKNALELKELEEGKKFFYIKTESEIAKDQLHILLREDDFERKDNDYIESLILPLHML